MFFRCLIFSFYLHSCVSTYYQINCAKITFSLKIYKKVITIKKTAIITLLFLSMTTMMSNVAIVTALPRFQDYFSEIQNIEFYSRLMLTLPSVIIALFSPFLGHLIFKFGKKKSAITALTIFALTGSAGLYLETVEMFLLSRALFGIAIATLMIVSTSLVGDYFQGEARHKFMGYQSAFMSIGGVVFVVGGGFLSDVDWRLPFGIYLIGFLLLPMVMYFLVEKQQEELKQDDVTVVPTNLIGVYFLGFFYMTIFFILPTQLPFLMINEFHASGKLTGSIIGVAFLANGIGAMYFSKFKKKYSFSTIYLIALTICAVGLTAISFVYNVYFFFLTGILLGFGGGVMMTNISAWMLSKTTFEKRVKASGYLTSSVFLGQFASPILFYPVVKSLGIHDFFLAVGVFLFVIVLIGSLYKKLA